MTTSCHYSLLCRPLRKQIMSSILFARFLKHWISHQQRNGSRNIGSGNKGHDGNHGQSSIVEFRVLSSLQLFRRHAIGKTNGRKDNGGKRSSLCVVHIGRFRNDFGQEYCKDNLRLSYIMNRDCKMRVTSDE